MNAKLPRLLFVCFTLLFALGNAAFSQPAGKKILLEKITSAGCPNCPNGDLTLHSLLAADSNIIPVAIHVNNAGHIDLMHSLEGDSVLSDYLWAHPTLMVDRYKFPGLPYVAGQMASWSSMINERKQHPMIGTIGGSTVYNSSNRSLTVHVNGSILWDLSWDLRINAYLVEDSVTGTGLGYDQLNGNNNTQGSPLFGLGDPIVGYVHNWVLRDMLGGTYGSDAIPTPVAAGFPYSLDFFTTLDSAWDASHMSVVLVLQRYDADKLQREVLNVAKIGLNDAVLAGLATPITAPLHTIWPNPASDHITIEMGASRNWSIQLTDLQGRIVMSTELRGTTATLETAALPRGMYLVRIQSPEGAGISEKIILR